jgi:hypothetical protein
MFVFCPQAPPQAGLILLRQRQELVTRTQLPASKAAPVTWTKSRYSNKPHIDELFILISVAVLGYITSALEVFD